MAMGRSVVAALALALCAGAAHAQLNKCTGADGKVSYSDKPCPTGAKGTVMIKAPDKPAAASAEPPPRAPTLGYEAPGHVTTTRPLPPGGTQGR
jgi:hypothetical protein